MVRTLKLLLLEIQVQSLDRDLRSCKLGSTPKTEKEHGVLRAKVDGMPLVHN